MGGPSLTIKGLHFVTKKRPGKPISHFVYAWRGGPLILQKIGGVRPALTPTALSLYHDALNKRKSHSHVTVAGLATEWRKSPEWVAYSADTRKQWGAKLSIIQQKWGDVPLVVFKYMRVRAKVVKWRKCLAINSLRGSTWPYKS